MARMKPIGLSAMHHQHVELGAVMVESGGWLRPARYAGVDVELEGVRKAVGICDVSPAGKLLVQGTDLDSVLTVLFGDLAPPSTGAARWIRATDRTSSHGVVAARLAHDEILIVTGPNHAPVVAEALDQVAEGCAHVVDITSALAGVRLSGPAAHLLLASLTALDASPEAFSDMSCAQARFAEVHGTLVRLDAGELPGYELYFGREFGEHMWTTLLDAGEEYGVVPFGVETLARLGREE